MSSDYFFLVSFLGYALILAFLIFVLSIYLITQNSTISKLSAYECGFEPYSDARFIFDVRFYLIAILFLVFDVELSFIIPWCLTLNDTKNYSFWIMALFLFILLLGFVYEWKKGALEWI
uniref:NADH dehydrogenase subunit 3 n=1 Tax=Porphyridium aerugineum TaxID=2792 RepID=UPI001FCD14B1|nr:NADH dehydrogenase subunit 3 [Porphyridium aerugineum]UNJ18824.1 NADH dehydrogenase subunit 3 [Porphyridium aerugineum]